MSKKIFNSIWVVALAVFLASLLFIMGMSYSYFSDVQEAQLRIETELAAKGAAMDGTNYLEGLGKKNYRITWIAHDGTVLYDSQADSAEMENHLEREEVRQALETELDDEACAYLKDFGAATASNGAVGLYHVENVTPEAVEAGQSLLVDDYKEYVIDDAEPSCDCNARRERSLRS